jgi:hypothetical protein
MTCSSSGPGRHGTLGRLRHGKVSRYCLAHARCPLLAIPAPVLEQAAGHDLPGWAFRHRGLTVDQISSSVSGR